jgi:CRISPR-associated endonuclease/helicase Cas3
MVAKIRDAWGKTDGAEGPIHPLVHHSMDVAAVFQRLIELPVISARLNIAAAEEGPLNEADCMRLSALAFLHDIGKLHPGFQAKGWPPSLWRGPTRGHLSEGWDFLQLSLRRPEHPFHATMLQIMDWGSNAVAPLISAIFAHHGRPVTAQGQATLRDWPTLPQYDWLDEARAMDAALHLWFAPAFGPVERTLPSEPRFHHAVAGLLALADWVGSDRRFFEFKPTHDPLYDKFAHSAASQALSMIGTDPGLLATHSAPDFLGLTGFPTPNPAQAVVGEVELDAQLLILEAETGSGKTEAAVWRYTQLLAAGKVSGLYFAVPTRAAARQLHGRIDAALRRVYGPDAPEAVLAIPGMVRAGEAAGRRLPNWRVLWEDRTGPVPARWSAEHATRFLASPVAVGTVDQAMLAGLQVKHAHMRGSALNQSLLVIDEIHASDQYMTGVLAQLLDDHLAIGGYAMLMSATLGSRERARWTREALPDAEAAVAITYPAVWVGGDPTPRAAVGAGSSKEVYPASVPTMDPTQAAKTAIAAAKIGARVLIIRNTVKTAAATWRSVQEAGGTALLMQAEGHPALHHGRYAAEDRALLDHAAETSLAPDRDRVLQGCIVIGTQTLEQSLDIDADMLISDLCPMDVLLQRIGRLHRHVLPRPKGFDTARVLVLLPEGGLDRLTAPAFDNGLGGWTTREGFNGIYRDLAGLELTQRLIEAHPIWRIPEMNRALVEGATHPDCVAALITEKGACWERYDSTVGGAEAAKRQIAGLNALDRTKRFDQVNFPSSDERIMTRLGEEGVILALDPAPIGPFGKPISRIALPARWSHGIAEDDTVEVTHNETGLILSVAGQSFHYSREGLDRVR